MPITPDLGGQDQTIRPARQTSANLDRADQTPPFDFPS
ncbi:hypothetical protein BZL30_7030 [Mycobacterium kansasii]|uniref:Uncharacterized protein n=1 Tax=Mycobacterium kansasii TaxID=1768 RepID=A0A1V3WQP5_MYCKA|nr:hypothetical protein BZL30_7030 [Mycobacterium kansasii]